MPERIAAALRQVLPSSAPLEVVRQSDHQADVTVNGERIQVTWLVRGWPADVRRVLAGSERPDVVVAPELSRGARLLLAEAGVGWVDETGAAEIARDRLIVVRDGRGSPAINRPTQRWTGTTLGVTEAILTGTRPTVAAVVERTGLSTGAVSSALTLLAGEGHLRSVATRGPHSGRKLTAVDDLLHAYITASGDLRSPYELRVGLLFRDPVGDVQRVVSGWEGRGRSWAATGMLAAAVMAPFLTQISELELYVTVSSPTDLRLAAGDIGLKPARGGRLVLRPMPWAATDRLCTEVAGLRCAPWPRVFADLRQTGVRGEDAADHLLSKIEKPETIGVGNGG